MTIRQALLRVRETRTFFLFLEADRMYRQKSPYSLTEREKGIIWSANEKVMFQIAEHTKMILEKRINDCERWRGKKFYTSVIKDKISRFLKALRRGIAKILPEYTGYFASYWEPILREEFYQFSSRPK
jgi:hypothetical protein